MRKGLLLVISGPSGCGKGTVLKEVMKKQNLYYSISMTTRQPREGEVDGVQYHFVSKEQFEMLIAQNGVLEHAEYCGNYYGTPREAVETMRNEGKDVILEIEVVGAAQVRENCPDAVSIFIAPPSIAELKRRLYGRGTESEETIQERIAQIDRELPCAVHYDYLVINDEVEVAAEEILQIIAAERIRHRNKKEKVKEVLES
ncbi:MAG: guanylate kinase [Oscillospiraceae bacterium]|nr:guanylate kinase [Oscillospiraceae bacterium]